MCEVLYNVVVLYHSQEHKMKKADRHLLNQY